MVVSGTSIILAGGFTLLGVFAGYWFNNINKKTERTQQQQHEQALAINTCENNYRVLREANEKSELRLRESMAGLSDDMRGTMKLLRELGVTVSNNTLRIQNLEDQHKFIAGHQRHKDNK